MIWFGAGLLVGIGVVVAATWRRAWGQTRKFLPDFSKVPDGETEMFPLKTVSDPETVQPWETVGYLTPKEMAEFRNLCWWVAAAGRGMEMTAQYRAPRLFAEGTMALYTAVQSAKQDWFDAVIVRRGWSVQRMHDSEYGLTVQYQTIRRGPASDMEKPVSQHKRERDLNIH